MDIGLSLYVDENVRILVKPRHKYTRGGSTGFPTPLLELGKDTEVGKEMEDWLQATPRDVTLCSAWTK